MSSCGRLWKYRSDNNNRMWHCGIAAAVKEEKKCIANVICCGQRILHCGIVICKRVIYRTDVLHITLSL